jgi:hypothetical protein
MTDKVAERIAASMSGLLGAEYGNSSVDPLGDSKAQRDRLNHRLASLELRRQANIEGVISMAFAVAGDDEAGDEAGTLDNDWLTRLVSHAQDVGNPMMQTVWGQVLTYEADAPGSFSLRTLDALAGMTGDDWGAWKRACHLCFPTGYLLKLGHRHEFDEFGVGAAEIARLQALGLVQETDDMSVTFYAPSKGLTFDYPGANLIIRHPDSTLFTLPAFRISGVARELLAHLSGENANTEYLQALGESLRAEGYDFRLRETH